MKKEFFIIKGCANTGHDSEDRKLEEVHLYAIDSANLHGIFDLVSTLSFPEQYALCKSFYKPGPRKTTPLINHEDIAGYRKGALETICRGMLRQEPRLITKKAYFSDPHMSHALFREHIDDYLCDELDEEVKELFEDHMLACDFCGSLFLVSRDIAEVLNKCGGEIFEGLVTDDEACAPAPDTEGQDAEEQDDPYPSPRKNDHPGSVMNIVKKCPHQLGLTFLLLDEEALPLFYMISRLLRGGFLTNLLARLARLILPFLRWFVP
ncbi:MAG: hypothetical protein ACMUIL_09045 [bacterium]